MTPEAGIFVLRSDQIGHIMYMQNFFSLACLFWGMDQTSEVTSLTMTTMEGSTKNCKFKDSRCKGSCARVGGG